MDGNNGSRSWNFGVVRFAIFSSNVRVNELRCIVSNRRLYNAKREEYLSTSRVENPIESAPIGIPNLLYSNFI